MESPDRPIFDSREDPHHIVEPGVAARLDDQREAASGALHNETLYDQNEDEGGERINLATGKEFDNSTYTGMEELSVRENVGDTGDDAGDDAAARWLRDNDPNYRK